MRIALACLVVLLLAPDAHAQNKIKIYVAHTGDDQVGMQLVY
jgi:hypothetical protein